MKLWEVVSNSKKKICPGDYLFREGNLDTFHKHAITWIVPSFVDGSLQYFTDKEF
jgi:hypothetical protein